MQPTGRRSAVDVAVVGGGQAGLTTSYYLRAFGIEHVVFERHRIGESWRSARWDSFTLVTPDWMTRVPTHRLSPRGAADFISRDAIVAVLEQLATGLPVRTGVDVTSVVAGPNHFRIHSIDEEITARVVVVAGGGQRRPIIPDCAHRLAASVCQFDASRYRNPAEVPDGVVLVVGSGQSGAQITEELAAAGREVLLATSKVARVPRRYRGRDVHEWSVELGLYDQPTNRVTDKRQLTEAHPMLSGSHGGHTIALQQLARSGVRLLGRLVDVDGSTLQFKPDLVDSMRYADARATEFRDTVDRYILQAGIDAAPRDIDPAEHPWAGADDGQVTLDTRAEHIGAVIWTTGFGPDLEWLHLPVRSANGIAHTKGVTAFPGLYVVGYPWLSTRGSGILYGVEADACRIAQHIAAELAHATAVTDRG
jgi:putative flavoprotein involved in K+ transport